MATVVGTPLLVIIAALYDVTLWVGLLAPFAGFLFELGLIGLTIYLAPPVDEMETAQ